MSSQLLRKIPQYESGVLSEAPLLSLGERGAKTSNLIPRLRVLVHMIIGNLSLC